MDPYDPPPNRTVTTTTVPSSLGVVAMKFGYYLNPCWLSNAKPYLYIFIKYI